MHGWKPEVGFLPFRWQGYNEALLLDFLALGSPTHPIPAAAYAAWTETYAWKTIYGHEYLYASPSSSTSSRTPGSISAGSRTLRCARAASTT